MTIKQRLNCVAVISGAYLAHVESARVVDMSPFGRDEQRLDDDRHIAEHEHGEGEHVKKLFRGRATTIPTDF